MRLPDPRPGAAHAGGGKAVPCCRGSRAVRACGRLWGVGCGCHTPPSCACRRRAGGRVVNGEVCALEGRPGTLGTAHSPRTTSGASRYRFARPSCRGLGAARARARAAGRGASRLFVPADAGVACKREAGAVVAAGLHEHDLANHFFDRLHGRSAGQRGVGLAGLARGARGARGRRKCAVPNGCRVSSRWATSKCCGA